MPEQDRLVGAYVHLAKEARASEALLTLKKVASLVKPIMRARGWKVGELAEFYPAESNLLGLNVNRGRKICLRLRYPGDRNQFLPMENVVDTMLHELAHIVHGPHGQQFHALWDQLRDECQGLMMKGYTGEGFLGQGRRLGGAMLPEREIRRVAREAAEKRRGQSSLAAGSGQRLGGAAPRPGQDVRQTFAAAAERRNAILKGCGSERFNDRQIHQIADTATRNGFRTQAEEDEANEAAIAQALWELVQEDDKVRLGQSYVRPSAARPSGASAQPSPPQGSVADVSSKMISEIRAPQPPQDPSSWVCHVCTLHNPSQYLCCDACGSERARSKRSRSPDQGPKKATKESSPQKSKRRNIPRASQRHTSSTAPSAAPGPSIWLCTFCGTAMERQWWTCSVCGKMKDDSK